MGCSGSKQQKDVAAGNAVPRRLFRKQLSKPATAAAGSGSKEVDKAKADDPARLTSSDEFYSSRKDMESLEAVIEGSEGAGYYSPGEVESDVALAVAVDVKHPVDKIAATGNGGDKAQAQATVRSEADQEETIKNNAENEEEFTMSTTRHNYVESIGSNGSMDFKEAISGEEIGSEISSVSDKKSI